MYLKISIFDLAEECKPLLKESINKQTDWVNNRDVTLETSIGRRGK